MENKEEWLKWIDDQVKDMYNDDSYTKVTDLNNRVFKTLTDDRDIAVTLLTFFKEIIQNQPK